MPHKVQLAGAILAGGRGARIGGGKPLVMLRGEPLIAHVAAVLRPAVSQLAVVGDAAAASAIGAEPLFDETPDAVGPLEGIASALEWAASKGADWLAVAPCDTPLLPKDVVQRLLDGAGAAPLAYALTLAGPQPLVAIWRANLGPRLRGTMSNGHPPVREVMDRLGAVAVPFDDEAAFFNVNTPADLAHAEASLLARGRAL